MPIVYEAEDNTYNPLCESKEIITHRSQLLLGTGTSALFPPINPRCYMCIAPVGEKICCCNCFVMDWPGISSPNGTACEIYPAAYNPIHVFFGGYQICQVFVNTSFSCVWFGSSYNPRFILSSDFDSTAGIFTWRLDVELFTAAGSVFAVYKSMGSGNSFTCYGGTLYLDSVDTSSASACAGISFPSSLTIYRGDCTDDYIGTGTWSCAPSRPCALAKNSYSFTLSGVANSFPVVCTDCTNLNGAWTLNIEDPGSACGCSYVHTGFVVCNGIATETHNWSLFVTRVSPGNYLYTLVLGSYCNNNGHVKWLGYGTGCNGASVDLQAGYDLQCSLVTPIVIS